MLRKFNVNGKSWLSKVYKSREVTEGIIHGKKSDVVCKREDFTSFLELSRNNGDPDRNIYQLELKNDIADAIIDELAEDVNKYCEYSIQQNGIKWTIKENPIVKTFVAETFDDLPNELPDWIGDEIKDE